MSNSKSATLAILRKLESDMYASSPDYGMDMKGMISSVTTRAFIGVLEKLNVLEWTKVNNGKN